MEREERLKAALGDRYRIESEIGSGGMATVYLAQDLRHYRKVAVKVLNPELRETPLGGIAPILLTVIQSDCRSCMRTGTVWPSWVPLEPTTGCVRAQTAKTLS
jgi:serine/threonine protein kinase